MMGVQSLCLVGLYLQAKQNNLLIQKEFLDELHRRVNPKAKVILITDAGFQSAWFRHIKSLGWDFIGRIRGTVQFCLLHDDERWLKITDVRGKASPEYPGAGWLARAEYARCPGHFYLHKRETRGRKNQRSRGRLSSPTTEKEKQASAKEPWLIFTSTEEFKPREITKLSI
ncbi:transposase [Salmonella enterica]